MRFIKSIIVLFLALGSVSCLNQFTKTKGSETFKSNGRHAVVDIAEQYKGTRYRYGGTTKNRIDCSGLIYVVFQEYGVELPRTSVAQSTVGSPVYIGQLQSGDLIFFGARDQSKKVTHAGIVTYSDGNEVRFIHSSSSRGVIESDLAGYWRPKYIKARRVL